MSDNDEGKKAVFAVGWFLCSERVFWGFYYWKSARVTPGRCPMTGAAAGSYAYMLITLQMESNDEAIMNYYRKLGFKIWQHQENKLQIMVFLNWND